MTEERTKKLAADCVEESVRKRHEPAVTTVARYLRTVAAEARRGGIDEALKATEPSPCDPEWEQKFREKIHQEIERLKEQGK